VSVHGRPPRLYFEPLKLLNGDRDQDPASKNNVDPDPQPWGAGSGICSVSAPITSLKISH
jgi:hypothetical protein